jgi:hypothetical protein
MPGETRATIDLVRGTHNDAGVLVTGEQPLHQGVYLRAQIGVVLTSGRARVACVDSLDKTIATNEESSWPAVESNGLRHLLVELLGRAGQENREGDAVSPDDSL